MFFEGDFINFFLVFYGKSPRKGAMEHMFLQLSWLDLVGCFIYRGFHCPIIWGLVINHKDPYSTTSMMESKFAFFGLNLQWLSVVQPFRAPSTHKYPSSDDKS